ncbi:unnamed protein product [Leptidea sinapis]|uniref:Uncharacterized protein n=1 Tax=Leptidea sinapis TaxID=189913 RepID=A0A5E4QRI8_9NEOP|nr:unnamed protein product [Leptidea sinapis]
MAHYEVELNETVMTDSTTANSTIQPLSYIDRPSTSSDVQGSTEARSKRHKKYQH